MKSVVLIGCGNIGFRHLQALCAMTVPAAVTVVEPNLELHDRIRTQFENSQATGHRFEVGSTLPSEAGHYDLAVIATTAEHRRAVVEQLLALHRVPTMILEKVLFQTIADVDAVSDLLERSGTNAFVNCGRRTFPGYQTIRRQLQSDEPINISVRGHRIGLASNAIHFLDLAEYLNDSTIAAVDTTGLRPGSQPGRRPGTIEIFGVLTAHFENGADLDVESQDVDPMMIEVTIRRGSDNITIDELARRVVVNGDEAVGFESQNVSETPELYQEALDTGRCVLTPYGESAHQHRLFIRAVNAHLGLDAEDDVACPIS